MHVIIGVLFETNPGIRYTYPDVTPRNAGRENTNTVRMLEEGATHWVFGARLRRVICPPFSFTVRSPAHPSRGTSTYHHLTTTTKKIAMPGLPKRSSHELLQQMYGNHQPRVTGFPPPPQPSDSTMPERIQYVPSQIDPMASLSTRADRENPLRLLLQDTAVLLANLRYLPNVFLPFKAQDSSDELYLDLRGIRDDVLQAFVFMLESALLFLAAPAILILPGGLWMAALTIGCLAVYLLCKPMEGPTVLYSNMTEETLALAEQHRNERWLFINGVLVG